MAIRVKPAQDYKPRDLTPAGQNRSGRLVKNMRIAGSGVYTYGRWELPSLGLATDGIPQEYENQMVFNVYRPPEVLKQHASLFARQPITIGHPGCYVTTSNAKQLQHGLTGDSVETEIDDKDGELYLYTSGTLTTDEGIAAYDSMREISLGYDPIVTWRKGQHKGINYQLVMTGMKDGNHVAIVPNARGGEQCAFMDMSYPFLTEAAERCSPRLQDGGSMDLLKSIADKLGLSKKPAGDGVEKAKLLLATLADGADPVATIKTVRELLNDVPAGDGKTKLLGYFTELSAARNVDKAVMTEAVKMCHELMDTLTAAPVVTEPKPASDNGVQVSNELLTKLTSSIDGLTAEVRKLQERPAGDYQPGTVAAPSADEAGEKPVTRETKPQEAPTAGAGEAPLPAADSKAGAFTAPVTNPTTDSKAGKLTSDSIMSNLLGRS